MAYVTPTLPSDGTTADASDISTPINQIVTQVNGNLDSTNLASNSVTTSKIVDASITNAKLATTAGEIGGSWQSWTPTWTNLTVGAGGTVTCAYMQIGKTVFGRIFFKYGTGSAVSGDIFFTLPVTAKAYPSTGNITQIGQVSAFNASDIFAGTVGMATTTTGVIRFFTNSTIVKMTVASSTVPFTWASNNELTATFTYEAA